MKKTLSFVLIAALGVGGRLEAREYSPRVVTAHQADTHSLVTFARCPRWANLKGDRLAWEVYQYLADPRTGLFPLGSAVLEGNDTLAEFQTVRDPVELLNVYGYGFCGILGPTMAGISEGIGLGRARTVIIPGWGHVVAETFYDGGWHYLDLDVRAAFRRADGSLASLAEAQRDASLWRNPGPLFFPLDPLDRTREAYRTSAVHYYNGHHYSGHTMDYVLRQGETFTRWWQPQGGRWHHLDHYHQTPFFRQLLERAPRGPKCKHQGWTVHTHGNGRFVYRPDLTDRSTDFDDGAFDADNVRPGPDGLTLAKAGRGYAVFAVRSPYVLVPLVGQQETADDDREASVVELDAAGASLSLSLDNGLTWTVLDAVGKLDLTRHVRGTYGYLLKIALQGEPGRAVVRSLTITTWVQLAPAALPALRQGVNRLTYEVGDDFGLRTRVVEIRTNGSDRADFFKYLHEPPADFDPKRTAGRARGSFVVKVSAPPRSAITWLSAGAAFATHQRAAARNTRNAITIATDEPTDYRPLYQADVPADQDHWHYNADRVVRLEKSAQTVYLRYVGDPGVNNLRVYAHCVDDGPVVRAPVTVTHAWKEAGVRKTKAVTLDKPSAYEIVTAGEPENESVELALPSRQRP